MPLLNPVRPDDVAKPQDPRLASMPPNPAAVAGARGNLKLFLASNYWLFLKWSFMTCILLWLLIYELSEAGEKLPDFVYVNF